MVARKSSGATRPKRDTGFRYILASAALETPFHMVIVELATLLTAVTAARKTKASISPYSTAVAALVDRISL
mgnify:CR=1 FL=1